MGLRDYINNHYYYYYFIESYISKSEFSNQSKTNAEPSSTRNVCGSMPPNGDIWTFRSYFVLINMVVSFVGPMHLLIWIYVRIYHAAHKNSERARRNSLCGATLDAVGPPRAPSR